MYVSNIEACVVYIPEGPFFVNETEEKQKYHSEMHGTGTIESHMACCP